MKRATSLPWFTLALLLAACGEQAPTPQPTTETAPPAAAAQAPAPEAAVGGILAAYVGKHPSEEVNGTRFLDQPVVKQAVEQTVPDAEVRQFIFGYDGPDAPFGERDGRLVAWGCERHNCGYHNWAILIAADGSNAEVCHYRNPDQPDGMSTWFLPGGRTEQRAGNCPSE
jgi:hypothetical protein